MDTQSNYPDHQSLGNVFGHSIRPAERYQPRDHHLVTLEEGEDGMIIAKCTEINVITQGKSFDDAEKNVVEAISLMREELGKGKEFSISVRRMS